MKTKLETLQLLAERVLVVLTMSIVIIMCSVAFLQVVMRYVFRNPLPWPEEVARYLMVWLTFLGFNIVLIRGKEMAVTYFADKLPYAVKRVVETAIAILVVLFLGLAMYHGAVFAAESLRVRSVALRIPMSFVYVSLPIGFFLSAVVYLTRLLAIWSKTPHGEQSHGSMGGL